VKTFFKDFQEPVASLIMQVQFQLHSVKTITSFCGSCVALSYSVFVSVSVALECSVFGICSASV